MASFVVLLGPPGAGKGTHAKMYSERYRLPHISTGDLLRSGIRKETALGKRAKSFVDNGKLVPDDLVIDMIEERLKHDDVTGGFILDGFPRTVEQAEALDKTLQGQSKTINLVLEFETSEQTVIDRLSGRRACPKCGANYHVRNIPPKTEGICDSCGTELIIRKDDQPSTVAERLKVYKDQTFPLIDFYKKRDVLQVVDGNLDIERLQSATAKYFAQG